ncbi:hypothetical protein LLG07_06260, partial [bacterium]|nr:hypothetical protein [bacterium]
SSLQGMGSPNFLGKPRGLFVSGKYVFVTTFGDNSLSIFKTNIGISENGDTNTDDNVSSLRKWLRVHNPYSI